MILGMSTSMFTLVHVVVSLVGILAGLVVLFGMFGSRRLDGWTALFLATTVVTSVTGFFFPSDHILPSHIVGAISLIVLAIAIVARYVYRIAGPWRWIYVASATLALYLNAFVGVVQAFQKLPVLASLAPTNRATVSHRTGCAAGCLHCVRRVGREMVSPTNRFAGAERGLI